MEDLLKKEPQTDLKLHLFRGASSGGSEVGVIPGPVFRNGIFVHFGDIFECKFILTHSVNAQPINFWRLHILDVLKVMFYFVPW